MNERLKAALTSLRGEIVDTWERSKMVILTIVGIVAALEFRAIYEWVIAYLNGRAIKAAENKDEKIKTQENALNAQADSLVKQAEQLPLEQKPISADWYKTEGGK